jgi:nucleoside phosphorylase
MPKEAKFIAKNLNLIQERENLYKKENITLLISGVGKQRTAICLTKYLCENDKPNKVINIGYAGSTDIPVGKWVNITRAYNYEWEIPLYSLKKISDNLSLENYHENVKQEDIFELHSSLDILKQENII